MEQLYLVYGAMTDSMEDNVTMLQTQASYYDCTYSSTFYLSYNLCTGSVCLDDSNCASSCCFKSGYSYGICEVGDLCGPDLTWLWWTLGTLFSLIIVVLVCVKINRHKQHREL